MVVVFWISVAVIFYSYLGYPALLWLQAKLRARPVAKEAWEPSVSVVMAVHNEASRLLPKLQNLSSLDYPRDRLEIVIGSDGSTDQTNELLMQQPVTAVICPENRGKAATLNAALAKARGEILVFTDVRQELESSSLRELTANFRDPEVGCVSGELMFRRPDGAASGVSLYWRFEKVIRKLESASGSVVGATGAFYAVRRELVPQIPEGALLDDVYIPLAVAKRRKRVLFEPLARAWDEEPNADRQEFRRKVRTLAGNYQLVDLAPWTILPSNPLWLRFISHKLLRLAVPFFLILVLASACALWRQPLYLALAILQLLFYAGGIAGVLLGRKGGNRLTSAAAAFCVLNSAAAAALFTYGRHRNTPTRIWKSAPSAQEASVRSAQASGSR